MQFVANVALDNNIPTGIRNHFFTRMPNPYTTRDWVVEKELMHTASALKRTSGVEVAWPGNDVKIDVAKLFAGAVASVQAA